MTDLRSNYVPLVVLLVVGLALGACHALESNKTAFLNEAEPLKLNPHPTRLHELYSVTSPRRTDASSPILSSSVSDECLYAVRDVIYGNYTNAKMMLLFSGKVPGEYGNYLECQELQNAHFCTIRYPVQNVTTVLTSSGICMPSVCNEDELTWALKHFPNPSWLPLFDEATAECVPKRHPKVGSGGIATLIVISILSAIVVLATVSDLVRRLVYKPEVPLASPQVSRSQYREELLDQGESVSANGSGASSASNSRKGTPNPFETKIDLSGPRTEAYEVDTLTDDDADGLVSGRHEEDAGEARGRRKRGEEIESLLSEQTLNGDDGDMAELRIKEKVGGREERKELGAPEQLWMKLLFCFSIAENMTRLAKHFPNDKTNLNPLNAVRVLAMMWVVLGHTCLFTVFIGWTNPIQALNRLFPAPAFQVLLNATLSVDVFFYLSGFLMAYFTLKELRQRKGRLNWIILFLHRLWRMTPTMVLALFFCWTVAPSLGNGPWWRTFMTWTTEACEKYWWTNLLYINNFWNFDLDQTCLAWTWYMSADMQFFVIAIPTVYILYRWPKIGFSILAGFSLASLAFIIGMSTSHHLSPLVIHMDDGYRKYLYTKPWARISTFCIGVVGAYLLLDHEERSHLPHGFRNLAFVPQTVVVASAWIISIVLVLTPIFGTYSAYQPHAKPWNTAQNTLFLAFSRPCFTLGLAIQAHLVMTSRASVSLKDALSHPVWTPFARLTFGAYLYHPIIMFGYYFSSLRPIEFTGTTIFQNWLSFTVLSFLASLVSFLLIERPTENLESVLISLMKERSKKKGQNVTRKGEHEYRRSTQSHRSFSNTTIQDGDEQTRSLLSDRDEENGL